ncbi:MAG TPA: STAS domain-containing protein, partial [Anaerolineales bacterium]|nr:STAS domain-containing protein [Anaerolineales bacterium]
MVMLSMETDNRQNVSLMRVKGRVDSETAPELDEALTKLLQDNRNKIVLNLQNVDYMSSAGLRAMVKAYQAAKKSGGDVRLACVSTPIEVILRTVGMLQMFQMYSTDQEAIASF